MAKKRDLFTALIIFSSSLFAPLISHAQSDGIVPFTAYQTDKKSKNQRLEYLGHVTYGVMANRLMREAPEKFDYVILRSQYMKSAHYDPMGERALQRLTKLAYEVISASSDHAVIEPLERYYELLERHIAHIGVVSQAIALSRDDERFGDTEKLQKIRSGLFQSIVKTGDGLKPETSYEIVTLSEETAVLRDSGATLIGTELIKQGIMQYHAHEIQTPEGIRGVLFTNVTFPMKHLEKLNNGRGEKLDLRKY